MWLAPRSSRPRRVGTLSETLQRFHPSAGTFHRPPSHATLALHNTFPYDAIRFQINKQGRLLAENSLAAIFTSAVLGL
jgi:hypothetical protein